jgi:hypothetical protein
MPLLSSPLLLRLHALTTLTLSYYLLTSPTTLLASPVLTLLGESMRLPPSSFSARAGQSNLPPSVRDALGLAALFLGVLGLTNLVTLAGLTSVPETLQFKRWAKGKEWRGQVPSLAGPGGSGSGGGVSRERRGEDLAVLSWGQGVVMGSAVLRVAVEGGLVGWVYLAYGYGGERRGVLGQGEGLTRGFGEGRGVGEVLGNQMVFSLALADMLFWGYLWTVIKEERRQVWEGVEKWKAEEGGKDE